VDITLRYVTSHHVTKTRTNERTQLWRNSWQTRDRATLTTISVAKYIHDQKDCASWTLYIISTHPSRLITCQSTHSMYRPGQCA